MPVDAASEMMAMSFWPSMKAAFSCRFTSLAAICVPPRTPIDTAGVALPATLGDQDPAYLAKLPATGCK